MNFIYKSRLHDLAQFKHEPNGFPTSHMLKADETAVNGWLEPHVGSNADEAGLFFYLQPEKILRLKGKP